MANEATETKLEPLDFIAPRAFMLTCDNCDADIDIQKGGRVRFSRGEDCWIVWDGQEDPGDGYAAEDPWNLDDGCGCAHRVHAELVALRDSGEPKDAPESFPDRVLRVARAAGYEPTGVRRHAAYPALCVIDFGADWCVCTRLDCSTLLPDLELFAGSDNQPEAVRERKLNAGPCDTRSPPEEHEMDRYGDHCVRCMRTDKYIRATARKPAPCTELATLNDTHAAKAEEVGKAWEDLVVKGAAAIMREKAREAMVNTIIAEQVARGGVDTEGTRAQAERWCAMLAGCVCEGMRATTDASAFALVHRSANGCGDRWGGKPLGRP